MNIIVIMGPHGSGKDTLIRELLILAKKDKPGFFAKAIYSTTRKIRSDEIQGETINCISPEEFEQLKAKGELACHTPVADYF